MNTHQHYWHRACQVSDIPARGSVRVSHGSVNIAIFKTADNELFALEDKCPHKDGPLSAGIVHGKCVTCPLHNWDISLDSGKALGADEGQTRRFELKVEDNEILLYVDKIIRLAVA